LDVERSSHRRCALVDDAASLGLRDGELRFSNGIDVTGTTLAPVISP
jgi:hypothetical protein